MGESLIRCSNVGKIFCRDLRKSLIYGIQDCVNEFTLRSLHKSDKEHRRAHPILRKGEFWANKEIDLEVARGECLGLIGRNGAGKTTLLKLLNGILKPDTGQIEVNGNVGAMIALGAGFSPILTARENIYVNGAILGLSRRQIADKIDEIVTFAELEAVIDSPIMTYSSGMNVRLGFACACVMTQPDILILDEVLAVGDAAFRGKCYNAIADLKRNTAVIFVSHSMQQIARMANKVCVLSNGSISYSGTTPEGIEHYNKLNRIEHVSPEIGSGDATICQLMLNNEEMLTDTPISITPFNKYVFKITIEARMALNNVIADIVFQDEAGNVVCECNDFVSDSPHGALHLKMGQNCITSDSLTLNLNPGRYHISALILSDDMVKHYAWRPNIAAVDVIGGRKATAPYQIKSHWKHVST